MNAELRGRVLRVLIKLSHVYSDYSRSSPCCMCGSVSKCRENCDVEAMRVVLREMEKGDG